MQKKIIILVAAVFIVFNLTLLLLVVSSGGAKPPPVKLPVPNGYDDFVAGAMKVSGNPTDFGQMSREQLAVLVSNNTEALRLFKRGVGEECLVPLHEFKNDSNFTQQSHLMEFRTVAQLIGAEGRLAELEGRTNDAARIYLNGIRFGQENCRGGLLITRMVGIACERVAMARLEALPDYLDTQNCRAVAQALESISEKEEPAQESVRQEETWMRSTGGFKGAFTRLVMAKSMKRSVDALVGKINGNTLHRRETAIKFAARAYELEKGKQPKAVSDLVPAYLKAAPKDPETDKEIPLVR
jgi:hypothetical protein